MNIENGKKVTLEFILRDDKGNLLDKTTKGDELNFTYGDEAVVIGLEEALLGKKAGDKFNVKITPNKGYGEYDENLTIEMPGVTKENLEITVQDNELEVKGHISHDQVSENENDYREFSLQDFYRKFKIGNDIDRNKVEAALKTNETEVIKSATDSLNKVWNEISQQMAQAQSQPGAGPEGAQQDAGQQEATEDASKDEKEVEDASYEVVDDEEEKK